VANLMNNTGFSDLSFPSPSRLVFDKMLSTGWYDGITAGVVVRSGLPSAFKLDILAWDRRQWHRIFAVSQFDVQVFDRMVALLAGSSTPTWPQWHPAWPSRSPENEQMRAELERILKTGGRPVSVLASDADFETIYAVRELSGPALDLLPPRFDDVPFGESFDYWKEYLGMAG